MDYLSTNAVYHHRAKTSTTTSIKDRAPQPPHLAYLRRSYENIYDYAYPVMARRSLTGSIFTVTQYMGQMNSWDLCCEPQHMHMDLEYAQPNGGRRLLRQLAYPAPCPLLRPAADEQQAEVWGSQNDLVSFLGAPAENFSYPYGQYPNSAEWAIAHSGFHAAVIIGQANAIHDYINMFELTRIGIADSDTLQNFITKITAP